MPACAADTELMAKLGVEAAPKLVVVPGTDAAKAVKHDGCRLPRPFSLVYIPG